MRAYDDYAPAVRVQVELAEINLREGRSFIDIAVAMIIYESLWFWCIRSQVHFLGILNVA